MILTKVIVIQCLVLVNHFVICEKTKWIYDFHAETNLGITGDTNAVTEWHLKGKLNVLQSNDYKIIKFDDLKVKLYNGPAAYNSSGVYKDLPAEAGILTEEFIAHFEAANNNRLESLSFIPEDPVWSINMKKAAASLLQVQMDLTNSYILQSEQLENNLYGQCKVYYKKNAGLHNLTIIKETDLSNCVTNKGKQSDIPYGEYSGSIIRTYTYKIDEVVRNMPEKIESNSLFKYNVIKSQYNTQILIQKITLTLADVSTSELNNDFTKYTLKTKPEFEFQTEPIDNLNTSLDEKALSKWVEYYIEFQSQLNRNASEEITATNYNSIEKLMKLMSTMNYDTLKQLFAPKFTTDDQMLKICTSLVTYLGSDASRKLIEEFYRTKYNFDLTGLKVFAFYPFYAGNLTENQVKQMEEHIDYSKNISKLDDNYILSFSILLSKFGEQNTDERTNQMVKEYLNKYYQFVLEKQDYNTKMKYLLALGNIGTFAIDSLITIINNNTETHHIRTLAIHSLKPLIKEKSDLVFNNFWPLVKDVNEHFEIRIAALSVLLDSQIKNVSNLDSIYEFMINSKMDASQKQLYNYFYSSIKGKLNCKFCINYNILKEFSKKLNPPNTMKGLMSGNYVLRYSDKENQFATSFSAHIVANPITNFFQMFQLSVNPYATYNQTNFNSFSIYVKAQGFAKNLFKTDSFRRFPVKEIFQMLKDYNINLKEEFAPLHLELVVFYEDKAIFSLFLDKNNSAEIEFLATELINFLIENNFISFKEMTNSHFVSDLGTPVSVNVKYEHIFTSAIKNFDKIFMDEDDKEDEDNFLGFKITTNWKSKILLSTLNPIVNTTHGVMKIFSNQQFVKLRIEYNLYDFSVKWKDDDIYVDHMTDYKTAVMINDLKMAENYCERCKEVYFYPKRNKNENIYNIWALIKQISIKDDNCNILFKKEILDIMSLVDVTNTGNPLLQPVALLLYYFDYNYYFISNNNCQFTLTTDSLQSIPNQFQARARMDVDPASRINKFNMNFNGSLTLEQRALSNAVTINEYNLNILWYQLARLENYKIQFNDIKNAITLKLHSKLDLKPVLKPNMFSLKPVEPIISKTTMNYITNDTKSTQFDINTIFSVSEKKQRLLKSSQNFINCTIESYPNYPAPTKECFDISEEMSTYDNYALNIQIQRASKNIRSIINNGFLDKYEDEGNTKDYNITVDYSSLNGQLNFDINNNHILSKYEISEKYLPKLLIQHTDLLINKIKYKTYGFESVCIISPDQVQTFTEEQVLLPNKTGSMLPLIECTNKTRMALITRRVANNRLGCKLWYDDLIIEIAINPDTETLAVKVNDKPLRRNTKNDDYQAVIFDDNSIVLALENLELYYNEKYITVKIRSIAINQMCGTCVSGDVIETKMIV